MSLLLSWAGTLALSSIVANEGRSHCSVQHVISYSCSPSSHRAPASEQGRGTSTLMINMGTIPSRHRLSTDVLRYYLFPRRR
ncbi:hypothetical protein FA13DRAFT_1110003 [Coprinellus micaceus]|uniref:Secreted protein n=1 Tax=Coprinellus micaceus TaxID=71717 RepID=A0A4Y7SWH2_COPMI|nr:hypothetical protein FA13DRAFT_1110003 [Coprinellus micaceus]